MQFKPTLPHRPASRLPDILGYGRLDSASLSISPSRTTARYLSGGDLVYSVRLTAKRCKIEEFYEGGRIGVSQQADLAAAFEALPGLRSPLQHPRLAGDLADMFSAGLNIRFYLPFFVDHTVYPHGLYFDLSFPISEENQAAWEKLAAGWARQGVESLMKLDDEKPSRSNGLVQSRFTPGQREFISLGASLFTLRPLCHRLAEAGVIRPGKDNALVIRLGEIPSGCTGENRASMEAS